MASCHVSSISVNRAEVSQLASFGCCLLSGVAVLQIVFQVNQDQAQPRAQMVTRDDGGKEVPVEKVEVAKKPYQFLWVSVLREYLAFEFKPEVPLSFEWDQERVYDDFGMFWIVHLISVCRHYQQHDDSLSQPSCMDTFLPTALQFLCL